MAKVCLIGSTDSSVRNMEHLVFRIAQILSTEHDIVIVGPETISDRIRERYKCVPWSDIEVVNEGVKFFKFNPILRRIYLLLALHKIESFDVVLSLGGIGVNGLSASIAGRILGLLSVVRITSDIFSVYRSKPFLWGGGRLFLKNNILGRMAIYFSSKAVLLHESQLPLMEAAGFTKDRFYIVSQPFTFPQESKSNLVLSNLKLKNTCRVILSTMRLDNDKKIALMADVIKEVLKRDPNVIFIIVGAGALKDWLMESLSSYSNVFFINQVPRDELASYYTRADIFLHLSKSEGLSNCIVEAMSFGLPVIASDSGVITTALVSNIKNELNEIVDAIMNYDDLVVDCMPTQFKPESNARLWLDLISSAKSND